MNQNSRSFNSIINIIFSLGSQLILILVTFINRTIFIEKLGAEYLGVNGLFFNILTLLSLAELGVGNVMIYSLYKPLEENDEEKISALIFFYKKIYRIISLVILLIGMTVLPFLKYIVHSVLALKEIQIYYFIFVLNSVFSYVCIYKTTLINADQRIYIIKWYNFIFQIIQNIIQIFIIVYLKDYLIYLIVQAFTTLLSNVFLSKKTERLYPFINIKRELGQGEKKNIYKNIEATMLYKVGVVIMNNTDNILISIILGTVYVGYYSNYLLIVSTINTIITLVISSIIASIGNLNAERNKERIYSVFNDLVLIFHWSIAFCSISLFFLLNDFITLWIGEEYILPLGIVFAIVLNFYVANVISPVWIYREALGLFEKIKYIMLIASILNIFISVILGKLIGMAGILMATVISRCLTMVWYEPIILYKMVFHNKVQSYFMKQIKYLTVTIISALLVYSITNFLNEINILIFIIKMLLCIIVPNLLFYLLTRKSSEFENIITMFVGIKSVK